MLKSQLFLRNQSKIPGELLFSAALYRAANKLIWNNAIEMMTMMLITPISITGYWFILDSIKGRERERFKAQTVADPPVPGNGHCLCWLCVFWSLTAAGAVSGLMHWHESRWVYFGNEIVPNEWRKPAFFTRAPDMITLIRRRVRSLIFLPLAVA